MSLSRFDASVGVNFEEWAAFFHDNGYIIIDNAIPLVKIEKIQNDLAHANKQTPARYKKKATHLVHKQFFEVSEATVDLVESGLLYDFAQYLIADVPGGRGNSLTAHLIHNNAFSVPPGGRGQAPTIHMDDCMQNVIIPEGRVLPDWVKLPVMVVTWMVWLSNCSDPTNGPTYVVPGSHRWGKNPDKQISDATEIPTCGGPGTAVLINNQTWHRGSKNCSSICRDTLQLTFARRIIGHKFGTIMNYQMPQHVLADRTPETMARMGFLQGGAYS